MTGRPAVKAAAAPALDRDLLEALPEKGERTALLALCLLAGLRVFAYASGLPLYTNIDEQSHLDLVLKYAGGHVPRHLEPFGRESSELVIRYGSPEYLSLPAELPGGTIPPPFWTLAPTPAIAAAERELVASWASSLNHESTGPPVYYAVAALWYRVGAFLGLEGGRAVYWIRHLNAVAWMLLVWMSWRWLRILFPRERLLGIGVPLLLAVFPQDAAYGINADALSPVLFAAAFFALLDVARRGAGGRRAHLAAGALAACAFLVKVSNVAIAGMLVAVCLLRLRRALRAGSLGAEWPALAVLASSAALPVALWMGWNLVAAGDLTGSAEKVKALGWTLKPLPDMLHHPLFGLRGLATFWNGVTATFWRGELVWHRVPMEWPALDRCYALATLVVVATMVASLLSRGRGGGADERLATAMGLLVAGLSLALLAFLSVAYDFGNCVAPSREVPFLTSGRLSRDHGALPHPSGAHRRGDLREAPVEALRGALPPFHRRGACGLGSRSLLPVFRSRYNWFHLAG
jgi:hypothetical protein